MRILAVSDMHGRRSAVDSIRNLVAEHSPDLLVICGDITDFGRTEWEGGLLDFIGIPVMAVDGNCDAPRVAQALASDRERGIINRTVASTFYP